MYSLTLTSGERAAIDAIGDRYANGNELRDILVDRLEDGSRWDKPGDITFMLAEYSLWDVEDIALADDNVWPCFPQELTLKMRTLIKQSYGE